jgi:glutamate--cysteine ligase
MDLSGSFGLDEARAHIARTVFEERLGGEEVGSIGLEPEYLVFRLDESGRPTERLPLEGESSVLGALERCVGHGTELQLGVPGPPPVYELANGGRVTFEPGAQVEHSTAVHRTAAEAMEDVDSFARFLAEALRPEGARIASAGLDLWTDRSKVTQQLRAPRYHAMDAYLSRRSKHGLIMMRHTGSFQINLDLGERGVAEERWRLSNLLSPIATASFACSPESGWKSRRARAWQGLDPTRTGFPRCLMAGAVVDPGSCYSELALDADILLFRAGKEGEASAGTPGFTLRHWIENGHPERGQPSLDDIDYHLTTLFPEVRLRGFFEIRSIDAIPLSLRSAQVVFWAGLLYDKVSRQRVLELLEPSISLLETQWVVSAREGFGDADLHKQALEIWGLALEGASRLPDGYFRADDLRIAQAFHHEYVERGRAPADELERLLASDPAAALDWCSLGS